MGNINEINFLSKPQITLQNSIEVGIKNASNNKTINKQRNTMESTRTDVSGELLFF